MCRWRCGACARNTSAVHVRASGSRGAIEAGQKLGGDVAAAQLVADLAQRFRIGDRRQNIGHASGGVGAHACRRHPAEQCPLLVDTLLATLGNALFSFLPPPLFESFDCTHD